MSISSSPEIESKVAVTCVKCGSALQATEQALDCPSCGASYPVRNGVPWMFESEFYWGEMSRDEARAMNDVARRTGWKQAVASQYSPSDNGWISLLDWQRASWLALLGLPRSSSVLDIGSGYGAITHALADHFDDVHSIEAIPERAEFTRIRLDQSGHQRVQLVRGSALELPYAEGSFDAIVVNGVLEWIGDWDLDGPPRETQLRFLRRVHSLLKPNGVLIVGIENRMSYTSFAGAIDHSGMKYTNLMPRWLATFSLRHFAGKHHRMDAPSRSYRTYTYTKAGYEQLFAEAGFPNSESFWADPGYNQPYRLTPLDRDSITTTLRELQSGLFAGRVTLGGKLKRVFARAGVLPQLVPDFVFVIRKNGGQKPVWERLLPDSLRHKRNTLLTTYPFAQKTTIRIYDEKNHGIVLKCSTPAEGSTSRVSTEFKELEGVWQVVNERKNMPFTVARPLGRVENDGMMITAETRAKGVQASMIFSTQPQEGQVAFLKEHLAQLSDAAMAIASLANTRLQRSSAASWLRAAQTVVDPIQAARARDIGDTYREWMAHGDFTLENCIIDGASLTVIDWEFVRDCVPPLYDLFCLYFSILNLVQLPAEVHARFPGDDELARFYTAFFHDNEISRQLAGCMARECERMSIDRSRLWRLFEDSLIFRVGYLVERRSSVAASRIRFLNRMQEWKADFQF